mmetsp:Transcript_20949/g.83481  ORF Transcript_20949/g.83481 Transcript_20949/m.83481 type:complete len:205 (-) Transcript_20949:1478-2092(-)
MRVRLEGREGVEGEGAHRRECCVVLGLFGWRLGRVDEPAVAAEQTIEIQRQREMQRVARPLAPLEMRARRVGVAGQQQIRGILEAISAVGIKVPRAPALEHRRQILISNRRLGTAEQPARPRHDAPQLAPQEVLRRAHRCVRHARLLLRVPLPRGRQRPIAHREAAQGQQVDDGRLVRIARGLVGRHQSARRRGDFVVHRHDSW